MSTAPTINPLSVACPRCEAEVEQFCKSKAGKESRVPHRDRVVAAGGTPAKRGPKGGRKTKTRATRRTSVQVLAKPGINSATIGAFMDDLEALRNKWALGEETRIAVRDDETDQTMAATYDRGAWLVSMDSN